MEIKEYKCPNCGGAVTFDSAIQKMKCPYCDAEFEVNALVERQDEIDMPARDNFGWDTAGGTPWETEDLVDFSTGSCPSCGAELVGDANTIAMVCPCCGNAQIVKMRIQGLLKPEYVIPFQLEKKSAVEALKNLYTGKKLLPDLFREENKVNSIQGLYVPFWLFDAKANGSIHYKAYKVKTWSDSEYNYRKTDFYSVTRKGSVGFEKIPVDGSEKMDNVYMDAIEPFDYASIKDFQSAFLAGYSAEKYDVNAENSKDRANARIKATLEKQFAQSVEGYVSVMPEKSSVGIEESKVSYALLPVWILNSKYKDENYQFMMNGQSGLMVGRLPVDKGKFWKYAALYTGAFGAAFSLIIGLLWFLMGRL